MKKVNVLSIQVNTGTYSEFLTNIVHSAEARESTYACIANVHTIIEAYSDGLYADIISNASYITPDGKPLAWAMKMLYGIKQDRVAGMDLLPDILEECNTLKIPVFFYGGTEYMLKKTNEYLIIRYPQLIVSGFYSPPFRSLTLDEEQGIIDTINESETKLVFVVLGCPKQEKWMAAMSGRIRAATVGVGGALPVLIGIRKRAPIWMQNNGMEWFFRLMQEPNRLIKRYAVTNCLFLYLIIKEYIRLKILNRTGHHEQV